MKQYPHGLDEEILPDDLETEQDIITRLEPYVEQGRVDRKSSLFKGLGKCFYSVGCLSYALDEPAAQVKTSLSKAFDNLYAAFDFGIPQQAYEFIRLLSLAIVTGNSDTAQTLAATPRERYTNENVEVEEVTFVVAEIMSAFIRKDKAAAERILAENRPQNFDTNRIFR